MTIKRFNINEDQLRLEEFLRNQYNLNKNMTSWLPQRLEDLTYRMNTQYTFEGKPKSTDYIFIWEENNEILGCILPDGDAIYISIKNGYENLFQEILTYAENNCLPLFEKKEDGSYEFTIVSNDSLTYRESILLNNGYIKDETQDFDNYIYPSTFECDLTLPIGFSQVYGDQYPNEINKWSACNLGFHPDLESEDYQNDMTPYNTRKEASMYKDSFESLIIDNQTTERNNVCSYCFVYVDTKSKTAFIEPVSTREKYRKRGFGKVMLHAVIKKCKELGIEKCYVNSYDWRRKFYNSVGFITEDSITFWNKKIK